MRNPIARFLRYQREQQRLGGIDKNLLSRVDREQMAVGVHGSVQKRVLIVSIDKAALNAKDKKSFITYQFYD
jgi:hypothetical protein